MARTYQNKKKILRDDLAIDRTILANERTLLAYARTSLATIVVGGTIIHFIPTSGGYTFGALLILIGLGIIGIGVKRFLEVKNDLKGLI